MRRLGELLDPEHAMLRELATEPASVQAISQRTGPADFAVWHLLARLEAGGYASGGSSVGGAAQLPRIYRLAAVGQRTVDGD